MLSSTRSLADSQAGHAGVSTPAVVGQGARAPLGRYANSFSPAPPQQGSRRLKRQKQKLARHILRHKLRALTSLSRVRKCGYVTHLAGGGPGARLTPNPDGGYTAGLSGLVYCGSVWACPCCSAKVAVTRAADLATVMKHALKHGCKASMVTLTIRHHDGQAPEDCWDAVSAGWNAVTSGKQWLSDQAEYGFPLIPEKDHKYVAPDDGAASTDCMECHKSRSFHRNQIHWAKAVEVTRGPNGWHVHVHALLLWNGKTKRSDVEYVAERMHRRWTRRVQKRNFDSWRDSGGLDVRMASLKPGKGSGLHEYFVKLSHEITGGQAKLAKGGGRTPFQILTDVFDAGEAADVRMWREWEKASFNRRQLTWSKGLREWAGLGREKDDKEIAEEQLEAEDMLFFTPESWNGERDDSGRYLKNGLRDDPVQVCNFLAACEDGGQPAAMKWLDRHGIGYIVTSVVTHPPPVPHDHEHWRLRGDRVEEARALMAGVARELREAQDWQRLLQVVDGDGRCSKVR